MNRAVVAFGSNLGDRVAHIENALSALVQNGVKVVKLSKLYQTRPMYVVDQASFLNGVALIETKLDPIGLLDLLQKIELDEGRVRRVEKGPRTLDLDIVLYGNEHIDVERLQVPHPLMLEREFVLRPLADVLQFDESFQAPSPATSPTKISQALQTVTDLEQPMFPVFPLLANGELLTGSLLDTDNARTYIMAILNITPDSFSDGNKLSDDESIYRAARQAIDQGATILDVGGQSTRPNATLITADEELERILPALRVLRELPEISSGRIAISIDTFYASVARTCIEQGLADIINDITAGMHDPDMLRTASELKKPIILMHMRGTPKTMNHNEHTDYTKEGGVVAGVARELAARVEAALESGIAPWRIVLDPGIGFAKTVDGNLELLRVGCKGLVEAEPEVLRGYPWLVGTSNKGFIGKITGIATADQRYFGTAASVAAAVIGGADIVRVHHPGEMSQVVKMTEAIYRHPLASSTRT